MSIIELGTNLNEMEEYEALPPGQYEAEIREVEVKYNEKNPKGYYVLKMLVHPDQFPADYDAANAPEGVPITYARVQCPDPAVRRTVKPFKSLIKAMGFDENQNQYDSDEWVGKTVAALLSKDEYLGTPTNGVESLAPVAVV